MKLIMENWRGYLAENQQTSYHDNLYLFENDTIKKTSFNDALDALTESDDDIEAFLENWEKSIDYELQQLNEGVVGDFIFNASVRIFLFIDKIKDKIAKHVVKIIKFAKKIDAGLERFKQKHPTIYKIGKIIIYVIILIAAYYTVRHIFDFASQGCPMEEGSSIAEGNCIGGGIGRDYDPDVIRASEGQLRFIGESLEDVGLTDIAEQLFEIANNPEDVSMSELGATGSQLTDIIKKGVQSMAEQGIEVDGAGNVIDKAQEIVNSLPELIQQPDLATADLVTGKVLVPADRGQGLVDAIAAADKLALDKIDGAGEVFKRVERDGYIYSIARPK